MKQVFYCKFICLLIFAQYLSGSITFANSHIFSAVSDRVHIYGYTPDRKYFIVADDAKFIHDTYGDDKIFSSLLRVYDANTWKHVFEIQYSDDHIPFNCIFYFPEKNLVGLGLDYSMYSYRQINLNNFSYSTPACDFEGGHVISRGDSLSKGLKSTIPSVAYTGDWLYSFQKVFYNNDSTLKIDGTDPDNLILTGTKTSQTFWTMPTSDQEIFWGNKKNRYKIEIWPMHNMTQLLLINNDLDSGKARIVDVKTGKVIHEYSLGYAVFKGKTTYGDEDYTITKQYETRWLDTIGDNIFYQKSTEFYSKETSFRDTATTCPIYCMNLKTGVSTKLFDFNPNCTDEFISRDNSYNGYSGLATSFADKNHWVKAAKMVEKALARSNSNTKRDFYFELKCGHKANKESNSYSYSGLINNAYFHFSNINNNDVKIRMTVEWITWLNSVPHENNPQASESYYWRPYYDLSLMFNEDLYIEKDFGSDFFRNALIVKYSMHVMAGSYYLGLHYFDSLIGITKKLPLAWYNRAVTKQLLNDTDGAKQDFEKAFKLDEALKIIKSKDRCVLKDADGVYFPMERSKGDPQNEKHTVQFLDTSFAEKLTGIIAAHNDFVAKLNSPEYGKEMDAKAKQESPYQKEIEYSSLATNQFSSFTIYFYNKTLARLQFSDMSGAYMLNRSSEYSPWSISDKKGVLGKVEFDDKTCRNGVIKFDDNGPLPFLFTNVLHDLSGGEYK